MRGAPPPPVLRPPNAAADHQFVGAQLYGVAASEAVVMVTSSVKFVVTH